MKKPTIDPITGKLDVHTSKLANRDHDMAMEEFVKTKELTDGGKYSGDYPLALIKPLAITPYQSNQNALHTRDKLLPVLVGDGIAESYARAA